MVHHHVLALQACIKYWRGQGKLLLLLLLYAAAARAGRAALKPLDLILKALHLFI